MDTIKLINRNDSIASVQLQAAIRQAVASIGGINEVILGEIFEDESSNDSMLPVYHESTDSDGEVFEEFLFNVNLSYKR